MSRFRIIGQQPLQGELTVNGAKNAATPVLAATLLCAAPTTLTNVPRIEDVNRIIELVRSMGAKVAWTGDHELTIDPANVNPDSIDVKVVRTLRSSILLMGALVGRSGHVTIPGPGGDQIGARPIDPHLEGFRELGIEVIRDGDLFVLKGRPRGDATVTLSEFSVTATENIILASVISEGKRTVVHCAAADPSVQDLCWFLVSRGAKIEGIGTHDLTIVGVPSLAAEKPYRIMPDPVETGTFLALGAASRSLVTIRNTAPTFLRSELKKLQEANVRFTIRHHRNVRDAQYPLADIVVDHSSELKAVRNLHNMPYPGFSADLLQPFSVLLTQANGTSLVHDWMYEGRLKYVEELNKMGAQIFIADPHRILVTGPSALYAADITSYDIRTGASLFIAALIASGTSTIAPAYQVDRGYEQLDTRLRAIGAVIERIDE